MSDEHFARGDIDAAEFRRHLHEVADWIADYRENIASYRISPTAAPGAIRAQLPAGAPENAEPLAEILADVDRVIMPGVMHWAHPQFVGYFGATTTAAGILAEMIAGALNVNAMTWRTSPVATELETHVLQWLQQWLTLGDEFTGVVYDTASISTMHALAAAREEASSAIRARGLSGRDDVPVFRIYTSDQAHSSVDKAAIALGLGEENVRRVASDAEFRMDGAALRDAVEADLRDGFKPLAVVATVGTTSTASIDPVAEIAAVCTEHGMWLHIDAAYGGGMALLPEHAWVTNGWNDADSLVVNPHKMLFVPFDFSALYVRNIARLRKVFTLKPWMVWRTFGRSGIAARIREHLRLAQLFTEWVNEDPQFELAAPTVMGVVCFRVVGTDDSLNGRLVEQINAAGETYLMQTKLRGRAAMRMGLGNLLTTEEHLRRVWEIIKEFAARERS
jgi:aromatic-L-amino-acid/L-tryptophan decarboxylase